MTAEQGKGQGKTGEPASPGEDLKRIVWDDSRMRSTYANVAHATGRREEILLLFGTGRSGSKDEEGIRWTDRITLSPFVAKKLALMLGRVVDQYEARFEALPLESPLAARPSSPAQASPEALRSHPRAGRLIALVEELGVQPLFERSFKVSDGSVNASRFLLGLPKREIEPDAVDKLLRICRRLDGPRPYLENVEKELPDSDFIHFGYEEEGAASLYKVYLEFSTRLERMAEDDPQRLISMMKGPEPFLMFLGFKWDPENPRARALTRYSWYPGISFDGMLGRTSAILGDERRGTAWEALADLLDRASERVRHDRINFFDVLEEESGRRSFDVNVYDAKLRIEEILDLLVRVGRGFSLPEEAFLSLTDRIQGEHLGHLSGGMDRNGRGFLTFYHGGGRLERQEPWAGGAVPGTA